MGRADGGGRKEVSAVGGVLRLYNRQSETTHGMAAAGMAN